MGRRCPELPPVKRRRLCFVVVLLCFLSHANAKRAPPRGTPKPSPSPPSQVPAPTPAYPSLPIRAVSLGGWLVTEGWIFPPLFGDIPNKDLLDGTQLQFKSALRKTYITADQGGGGAVLANRTQASDWETFKVWFCHSLLTLLTTYCLSLHERITNNTTNEWVNN